MTITGQLGEVMRESVLAALTWMRANAERLGLSPDVYRRSDVHVHVPVRAVPKNGPSAGVVMAVALVSAFIGRPVKPLIALAGEITLTGEILPVGGIKEKVLAAKQRGVREIVLPEQNRANVAEELPPDLQQGLVLHFVSRIEEALALAFEQIPLPSVEKAPPGRVRPTGVVMT